MTTITETATYEVITDDQISAEAFGMRYRGINAVQAAKIEKIHTRTKARIRDMSDRVPKDGDAQGKRPQQSSGRAPRPHPLIELLEIESRTFSQSEFTHDSAALVADAKYEIEKIAAKAPLLVRERVIPVFDFSKAKPSPVAETAAETEQAG